MVAVPVIECCVDYVAFRTLEREVGRGPMERLFHWLGYPETHAGAVMNRGNWRQAAEYFADDVQHHRGSWQDGAESIVRGKKALTDNLEDIFRTFPD